MSSFVFIDARVQDYEPLIAGLAPDVQVVILDPGLDGVTQIAEALAGTTDLASIHIISHGESGTLYLGSTVLTEDDLEDCEGELAQIGASLSETGDILLYGCNVGSGETGESFIASLADYTGAGIAASTDLTGSTAKGGDWQLEVSTGTIETAPIVVSSFEALLAVPALTLAGTLDSAFDGDGRVTTGFVQFFGAGAQDVALLPDGKIVAAGYILTSDASDIAIARYNADGMLDTTFSGDGKLTTAIGPGSDAEEVVVQTDGRILVAGTTWSGVFVDQADIALARYNSDGTLDSTFGSNGKVITAIGTDQAVGKGAILQADGKILVAGYGGDSIYFPTYVFVARYNSNGTLDDTFDADGIVTTTVPGKPNLGAFDIALQSDGRIVVAGYGWDSDSADATADFVVVRYNADGTLDSTFDGDGKLVTDIAGGDDIAYSVSIQSDGKIIVAGGSNTGSKIEFVIARYNADGTPDSTFDSDGKLTTSFSGAGDQAIDDIVVQDDGKIVAAGTKFGSDYDFAVARYDTNGALDGTFSGDGKLVVDFSGSFDSAEAVALQRDGSIVVAGDGDGFALIRVIGGPGIPDQSTAEDAHFSLRFSPGIFTDTDGDALTYTAMLADGTALPAWLAFNASTSTFSGTPGNGDVGLLGIIVTATDPGGLSVSDAFDITIVNTNDAPVVSGGGAFDNTFDTDGKLTTSFSDHADTPYSLALQGDGRIVVAGRVWNGSDYDFVLVRYDTDGTLDSTFDHDGVLTEGIGTGADWATGVAVEPDGRVIVAGTTDVGVNYDFALVRYNIDGALDTTFGGDGILTTAIGAGDDQVTDLAVQSDGRILLAGIAHNGTNYDFALARYNVDGTPDTTFGAGGMVTTSLGTARDIAESVVLQSDGKILVAGYSFNGLNDDFALVRYSADGSLDSTFGGGDGKVTTAIGSRDEAYDLALQADGKIVLAGWCFNGGPADFALARYNTDGTLDTTFSGDGKLTTDFGLNDDYANSVVVQSDGRIVVAGESSNGSNYDFALARYNTDGTLDAGFDGDGKLVMPLSAGDDYGPDVALQADGGIVLAGFAGGDFGLVRVMGGLASIPDQLATEDAGFSLTFASNSFADPEGDAVIYSATRANGNALPNWLVFDEDTRTFSGTPANEHVGFINVKVIATDDLNASGFDVFRITVSNTNDGPAIANAIENQSTQINNPFSFAFASNTFNDVDAGDTLTYTAKQSGGSALPAWLSFNAATRTFSGTPLAGDIGNVGIRVTARDGSSIAISDVFTLSVVTDSELKMGADGPDFIFGGTGNDTLNGLGGADTLDGGTGIDRLVGSADGDTYIVDEAGDVVVEQNVPGTDLIESSVTYTLPDDANAADYVENLTLIGSDAINATGNFLPNILTGNAAANRLDGGGGGDIDLLVGGGGNDTYIVDNENDQITEGSGAGTGNDLVRSGITYTLAANLERLILTGSAGIDATGNGLDNTLIGNAGANTLNGLAGDDAMAGGAGNDTYVVNSALDTVSEGLNKGSDLVRSLVTWTLGDNVEDLILTGSSHTDGTGNTLGNELTGNSGDNVLVGGSGNDTLDGGPGDDTLRGGAGNDVYFVDTNGDVVVETENGGIRDQVVIEIDFTAEPQAFQLYDNVELVSVADVNGGGILVIGNDLDNLFTGGNADDQLDGQAGNDTLEGLGGDDTLDGGTGSDSMEGGAGDDLYYVDDALDELTEVEPAPLPGDPAAVNIERVGDTVIASISYALKVNFENLELAEDDRALTGTGNAAGNAITGNSLINFLYGLGGNDTVEGGAGADGLSGGAGVDTVSYASAGAGVTVSLVTGTATGGGGADQLDAFERMTGSRYADRLIGDEGNNVLDGRGGTDTLTGGAGADKFVFSTVPGATNADSITNFVAADDTIQLDRAVFTIALGELAAGAFYEGTAAHDANDRIIYNTNTGALYYDEDGMGDDAAVHFATLLNAPSITAADFFVVA